MATQAFSITVGVASGASATIALAGGATYTFAASAGVELDAYIDPPPDSAFTQRCIKCTAPGLTAFRAYYRPDVSGGREEWVFELGDALFPKRVIASVVAGNPTIINTTLPHQLSTSFFVMINDTDPTKNGMTYTRNNGDGTFTPGAGIGQSVATVISATSFSIPIDSTAGVAKTANAFISAWDLPAYDCTITRASGTTLAPIHVPFHYFYTRWRWQSLRRPVRRTAAQLWDANLIPKYDWHGLSPGTVNALSLYTPMSYTGSAGPTQGSGGIDPVTGILSGWQVQYLTGITASLPDPEVHWRSAAESNGTMQTHLREAATEAPLNLQTPANLKIGIFQGSQSGATSFWYRSHRNDPDSGHFPSSVYAPYLLTGDPYYLEELQFVANYHPAGSPGSTPPSSRYSRNGRYFAWPAREVGQAYTATPASGMPNWLLSKAYFKWLLDGVRDAAAIDVNNTTDPYRSVFHSMPDSGQHAPPDLANSGDHIWQHSYNSFVACWLATLYPADFMPWAIWGIISEITRTSPTWRRDHVAPYHLNMQNISGLAVAMGTTETTMELLWQTTFAPGETVIVGGNETMTLGSSSDGIHWTVTRPSPKAHATGVNTSTCSIEGDKFISWDESKAGNQIMNGTGQGTRAITSIVQGNPTIINFPAHPNRLLTGMSSVVRNQDGVGAFITVGTNTKVGWPSATITVLSPTSVSVPVNTTAGYSLPPLPLLELWKETWGDPPVDGYVAGQDLTYGYLVRSALAQAVRAGLPNAGLLASFNWIDAQIRGLWNAPGATIAPESWNVIP